MPNETNPNIILAASRAVQIPPFDPMEAQARALKMQSIQAQAANADLERQMTLRDMADSMKVRQIISSSPNIEDAIPQIMRINPKQGIELGKSLADQRKARLDATKTELESGKMRMDHALRLVHSISDEASFAKMIPLIEAASPEVAGSLGPAWDPKRKEAVTQMGMSAKETIEHQLRGLTLFADGKVDQGVGRILSTADSQEELDGFLRTFASMGVPRAVVDVYGTKWDKDYKKRAGELSMTEEERGQAAERISQATDREERRKISWAEYNLKVKQHNATEADVSLLSDEAVTMLATQMAQTGVVPPVGMGKAATNLRTRIYNEAAKQFPGLQPGLAKALFEANKGALTQVQKNLSAVNAFEKMAKANLNIFIGQAKRVIDTGSPYLNKPLRDFSADVLGQPQMAGFRTARQTAVNEVAKVLNSALGNAALSDSARHEIDRLLPEDATLEQYYEAANVAIRDMSNRPKFLEQERADLMKRISATPDMVKNSTAAPAAVPAEVQQKLGAQAAGKGVTFGGKTYRKNADGTISEVRLKQK